MSRKPASTIAHKPDVAPSIESWIAGANQNQEAAPPVSAVQPAGQPASQQASMEATRMLSVRIPAGLHQRLRVHSVSEGHQIQDIVSMLLAKYLAEQAELKN